jgi:hypothetical protein
MTNQICYEDKDGYECVIRSLNQCSFSEVVALIKLVHEQGKKDGQREVVNAIKVILNVK